MGLVLVALFTGLMLAVQNPLNVKLGSNLNSPVKASLVGYLISAYVLLIISLVVSKGMVFSNIINTLTSDFNPAPWWAWTGGLLGAFYITSIIILFPKLGPIQAVILPTLGQIAMSILIDSFGWFEMKQLPFTFSKAVGILLFAIGIYIVVVIGNKSKESKFDNRLSLKIWAIAAGIATTLQSTFNGDLGIYLDSSTQATFVAFTLGLIAMIIFVALREKLTYNILTVGVGSLLGWVASLLGLFFVLIIATLIPKMGPGLSLSASIVGLMIGSAFVQHFGWFDAPKARVNLTQILGILILIVGIVVIKLLG